MITGNLIDRLNHQANLTDKVLKGRRHALSSMSRCVVMIDDGRETREEIFDQPPTIGQLIERAGADAWVVSVKMRRVPRRAHQRRAIAAK